MTSKSTTETRMWLLEVLGKSIQRSQELQRYLAEEHQALVDRDEKALQRTLDAKKRCVEQLQSLERVRIACCERAGFKYSPTQMDEVCESCDKNSLLAKTWQQLLEVIAECRKLNQTISAFTTTRQRQLNEGLRVLCGIQSSSDTYDHAGTEALKAQPRELAEA